MKPNSPLRAAAIALIATTTSLTAACGGTGSSGSGGGETVTVYTADGLANWYKPQFDKFTKDTGIAVNLVEAGSGEVVSRVEKEQSNPQADLLVTLPPFIQKADKSGLLSAQRCRHQGDPGRPGRAWRQLRPDRQQRAELHRQPGRQPAAQDVGRPARAAVQGQAAVLHARPGRRRHRGAGPAAASARQAGCARLPDQVAGQQCRPVVVDRQAAAQGQQRRTAGRQRRRPDEPRTPSRTMARSSPSSSPLAPTESAPRSPLPYVAGVAKGAPHADSAKKLLAFLLSDDVQKTVEPDALGIPVRDADPHRRRRVRLRRIHPRRCSTASTSGCRTGTPCSPSSTPTWPPIRRPPVTEMAERPSVGRVGTDEATAPRSSGSRRNCHAGNHVRPRRGVLRARRQGDAGAGRLQPAGRRRARRSRCSGPADRGSRRRSTRWPASSGRPPARSGSVAATSPICRRPSGGSVWCCSPTRCSRTCGCRRTSRSG